MLDFLAELIFLSKKYLFELVFNETQTYLYYQLLFSQKPQNSLFAYLLVQIL